MKDIEIISRIKNFILNNDGLTIGLIGPLGAGKTFLVKAVLSSISSGFIDQVVSPTYNLCCVYQDSGRVVHHFDLYRIEEEDELYDIDLFSSVNDSSTVTIIEWIDMFPFLFDTCDLIVTVSILMDGNRDYEIRELS